MVTSHQMLTQLDERRRAHSLAVAKAAATRKRYVPAEDQDELITAALLHDIGYAVPDLGFHPIDGATYLQERGELPPIPGTRLTGDAAAEAGRAALMEATGAATIGEASRLALGRPRVGTERTSPLPPAPRAHHR